MGKKELGPKGAAVAGIKAVAPPGEKPAMPASEKPDGGAGPDQAVNGPEDEGPPGAEKGAEGAVVLVLIFPSHYPLTDMCEKPCFDWAISWSNPSQQIVLFSVCNMHATLRKMPMALGPRMARSVVAAKAGARDASPSGFHVAQRRSWPMRATRRSRAA